MFQGQRSKTLARRGFKGQGSFKIQKKANNSPEKKIQNTLTNSNFLFNK